MANTTYPAYTPSHGYMTEKIQRGYIAAAMKDKSLPDNAHRMPEIVTLNASKTHQSLFSFGNYIRFWAKREL